MSNVQELQILEGPQRTVAEEFQEEVFIVQPPSILLDRGYEKKAQHTVVKNIFILALAGIVLLIALPLAAIAILKTRQYDLM
jgi:hypothetical protein